MLSSPVTLRPTEPADLPFFFRFQLNQEAAYLAAFMPAELLTEAAYLEKYTRFLHDPTIHMQTILVAGIIVGSLAKFEIVGKAELTYWLDRACWGKGIATSALRQFLSLEPTRPLIGRVAFDNVGSQKVLEKNGFVKIGAATGFATARQAEIEEFSYQLS
jgi:ribosomal-protein-alanine N-acetyltransferase